MASAASHFGAAAAASSPKPVDQSLWWDSFVHLFEELDAAPLSSDLPENLVKKIKSNHAWFLDTVVRFKPPNQDSRLALDSPEISVGSHRIVIKPELKEASIRASKCLCLDEVQSYIVVNRSFELKKSVADVEHPEFLHLVLLQYYLERQCLLKCVRRIFAHALYVNVESSIDITRAEALQLISDGLEGKLVSILQDLFLFTPSENTEFDFMVLWVEESLIEDNLVLDILFLFYYDNFCNCRVEQWKTLCLLFKALLSGSFNVGKLTISVEARKSFVHAKAQLLLVLIETLDLESLLQTVHDEVPFRQEYSSFTLSDIQVIDAVVSGFSDVGAVEAGPLVLAWAVFVCLLLSLPDSRDYNMLAEIDHTSYVSQAFEVAPFNYLLDILRSDTLRKSDGLISGYLSVLRTFVSAFIASYDLNHETDGTTLDLILDIICQIYQGEESLAMQFWDRESFVDAPIRSILYMFEREYPFHIVELLRMLSALSEGTWAADCVYNFLEKMRGVTLPFEIPGGSHVVDKHDIVEAERPVHIPGVEGFIIPSGSRGHVLKVIDEDLVLVHWECLHSGIFLLLLRLAQESQPDSCEDVVLILNLLYRMVSSNKSLCFSLLHIENSLLVQAVRRSGQIEHNLRIDVVKIVCTLVFSLVQDVSNASIISICVNLLTEFLKSAPSHVIQVALRSNLFRTEINSSSNGSWLLSGGLARMLLADSGENAECCPLTTAVLDFTAQLLEGGADDDMVSALAVFSLQYVLVHHLNWTYKFKHERWKVTLKVLEVVKSSTRLIQAQHRLNRMLRDILFYDSSIQCILCRIICIATQSLTSYYVTGQFELKEIEGLQLAVCLGFDIVYSLLSVISKEAFSNIPAFVQTLLSSATKPIPFVTAAVSLVSLCQNPELQIAAARILSVLCCLTSTNQPYSVENVTLLGDIVQVSKLSTSIYSILDEEEKINEDLLVSMFNFLTSAALYQPAILVCIFFAEEEIGVTSNTDGTTEKQLVVTTDYKRARFIELILKHLERSKTLIKSAPLLLLSILGVFKALWGGGVQYIQILEKIRSSEMFWKNLLSVFATEVENRIPFEDLHDATVKCTGYRYHCQGAVMEIMAHELFLQEKLLLDEVSEKHNSVSLNGITGNRSGIEISKASNTLHLTDIFSTFFGNSTMGNLIKSYTSPRYDKMVIHHAEIAVCLCVVHLVGKLLTGNAGNLSISLVEKIRTISCKLGEHPAFSALTAQYLSSGYSEGKELTSLILNDLYYHLQGELEGRKISTGHFQELLHFLCDKRIFQSIEYNSESIIWPPENRIHMFDIQRLQAEFGIDQWDYFDWKASKEVAETMFLHMHAANFSMFLTYSQCFALKAVIDIVSLFEGNIPRIQSLIGREIPEPIIASNIEYLSKCLQETEDSFIPAIDPPVDLVKLVTSQTELLLVLTRILFRQLQKTSSRKFLPLFLLLMKTSSLGVRSLSDVRPSTTTLDLAVKLLLMLLLTSIRFIYAILNTFDKSNLEDKLVSESSLTSMGLLPVLCLYIERTEFSDLSVAAMDLMLKGFLAPNSWLPILQKHLQLVFLVQKIERKDPHLSVTVMLNFFLTLAQVKCGAEMLLSANIFSSLKILFSQLLNDKSRPHNLDENYLSLDFSSDEIRGHHWGLSLSIITSMIQSLGDDISCVKLVDNAIGYFFLEKGFIISSCLSPPIFPAEDSSKKRARTPKMKTSLMALRLTEHTLMLVCLLARHQASWRKGMKERDSELQKNCIHLLAFISRGIQRPGDSPNRAMLPFCPPTMKEEVDLSGKPPFARSKHGWFALSTRGILMKSKVSADRGTGLSQAVNGRTNEHADLAQQSLFSETVAVQVYRISHLILKFLCMQANEAGVRAEEMELIDLAHFPELPVPEILHGLQDQAIVIVTELCEANRSESIQIETAAVCLLLLQILEKSLYLELCVSQACGIRPVLGRIEDFSKEIKLLMEAVEPHTSFKASLWSLRQIIALMYPGLL